MQRQYDNNAEKIIKNLDKIFDDINSFPDGEIKQSLEKIKIKTKELETKNNKEEAK